MAKIKALILLFCFFLLVLSLNVFALEENIKDLIDKYQSEKAVIGIDVSYYQGNINWKSVSNSGIKFAIIRCGYRGYSKGTIVKDEKFDKNIKSAIENGINVGVYFYSNAINEDEALEEAITVAEWIKNYKISYFVAYDFEDFDSIGHRTDGLSIEQINKNAKVFLDYISNIGYKAVLYGNSYSLNNYWKKQPYNIWVAHYNTNKPTFKGNYQMWQCTDKALVPGIEGNVDVDIDYYYWKNINNIKYKSHIQDYGWLNYQNSGDTSGIIGQSKRLEAMNIEINNELNGGIRYKSHIQDVGWEDTYKQDGEISGTTGKSKRLEAIKIELYGELLEKYDVYYRTYIEGFGWLGWAKNGEESGSEGLSKMMEAIQIVLIDKGASAPGDTACRFVKYNDIIYKSHIQDYGWQNYVSSGLISGTVGQSKRMEAISLHLKDYNIEGGIQYRSHIQDIGWEVTYKKDGEITGTTGESKRLEAIEIKLYGEISKQYDIYYRAHIEDFGWLGWAKNGEKAGSEGLSKRMEAIEIIIVPKNTNINKTKDICFIK